MRKTLIICLYLMACINLHAINNLKPFVIPEIKHWIGTEGQFTPSITSRIVITKDNEQLHLAAEQLAEDWNTMFGLKLPIVKGKANSGDIVIKLTKGKNKESYSIITNDKITISSSSHTGLYWATRTILQIAEQNEQHSIPCGTITDEPEYPLRGLMIDCGRKYIPLNYLQSLVKVMAYYKMNTLQVHLNDNGFKQYFQDDWDKTYSGFRLESETYPGLASADGYYGKDEFRAFQKEAAKLGVEIIPEIDAPAHTLAFTHYKKALGSSEYGLDHMDLFNPESYEFLDALYKEYLEGDDPVFVGPRVHIGTDEYSNRDSLVVEKFRYFTDRYIKYVESFGKQAVVWGALTHAKGKTPVKAQNVIMSEWYNGYADPKEMKGLGYKLISIPDGWVYIVPQAGYYYDYLNIQMLYDKWTPANINGVEFPERDPSIIGGMFAVWNDHCGNGISVSDIHHRVFPALQTLATKCWSASFTTLPFDKFNANRQQLSEAPGVYELGRYLKKTGVVVSKSELFPNTTDEHIQIGYDYRVSFNIDATNEEKGTVLLSSPRSTFYLADPIGGYIGFSRDDYLITFSHKLKPGIRQKIAIEGDNQTTRLYIDGKLVEELNTYTLYHKNDGKGKISQVRTLVFPLQQSGNFKSKITNFCAEQLK